MPQRFGQHYCQWEGPVQFGGRKRLKKWCVESLKIGTRGFGEKQNTRTDCLSISFFVWFSFCARCFGDAFFRVKLGGIMRVEIFRVVLKCVSRTSSKGRLYNVDLAQPVCKGTLFPVFWHCAYIIDVGVWRVISVLRYLQLVEFLVKVDHILRVLMNV